VVFITTRPTVVTMIAICSEAQPSSSKAIRRLLPLLDASAVAEGFLLIRVFVPSVVVQIHEPHSLKAPPNPIRSDSCGVSVHIEGIEHCLVRDEQRLRCRSPRKVEVDSLAIPTRSVRE